MKWTQQQQKILYPSWAEFQWWCSHFPLCFLTMCQPYLLQVFSLQYSYGHLLIKVQNSVYNYRHTYPYSPLRDFSLEWYTYTTVHILPLSMVGYSKVFLWCPLLTGTTLHKRRSIGK